MKTYKAQESVKKPLTAQCIIALDCCAFKVLYGSLMFIDALTLVSTAFAQWHNHETQICSRFEKNQLQV